jgi:hypothetical protein
MNLSEIKNLLISSLNSDADPVETSRKLEEEGISYDFSKNFSDKVLDKIFTAGLAISHEMDYLKTFNFIFYRIAFTGIAAIVVLLISIYLKEGSLSFNSFLGINNNYDESIVSLLTGN